MEHFTEKLELSMGFVVPKVVPSILASGTMEQKRVLKFLLK
jgi:hypothetical protein